MSETGSVKEKLAPHEVTAEVVYKCLNELRAQAKSIYEMQVQTNEKLINNPGDKPIDQSKEEVDRPVNPRHFPGFRDICDDISAVLSRAQRLQEYLIKHI